MSALINYLGFNRNRYWLFLTKRAEYSLRTKKKKSLNKALHVSALFSLGKVLMGDSFQYLLKNVYSSFTTQVMHVYQKKNFFN